MATNDEPLSMGYTRLVNVYSQIKNKDGIPDLLDVLDKANRRAGKELPFYTFMDGIHMGDIRLKTRTEKSREREMIRDRQIAQRLIDERIINTKGEVIR